MFKTLINAWKLPELRKKMLYTVLLLAIFRFGCVITAPGVDAEILGLVANSSSNALLNTVNIITGGAFSTFSIFALSISPYITASIVLQLLTYAIPSLEELSKEENGRAKISRYTRYLSVVLAAIESFGVYMMYRGSGVFLSDSALSPMLFVLSLATGSTLLMWIAEQLTTKGIGNGISLLIFAGIISGLPSAAEYLYEVAVGWGAKGIITVIAVLIGAIVLIAGVVWVTEAERRVPVQYAKRVVGRKMYSGQNTHIPLKPAMAGVMPVIFAMSFMQIPVIILQLINSNIANETGFWAAVYKVFGFTTLQTGGLWDAATSTLNWSVLGYGLLHILIYVALIVFFTFFYTLGMAFNPKDVANNLKKNGGFIPGIRSGKPTEEYLREIVSYLTMFGSIFLAIIAVLPILTQFMGLSISFGGTAILIVVGVALETIKQLESQMLTRHYKGFLE